MSINSSRCAVESRGIVCCLLERAEDLTRQRGLAAAEPLFTKAIATDPTPAARIAYAVELGQHDPQAAIAEFEIAWEESCRLQDPCLRANCCRNLALLFARTGDLIAAEQYRQLAISAELDGLTPETDSTISPTLLSDIAAVWLATGDEDSAETLLTSAENIVPESDVQQRAIIESHRGVIAALRWRAAAAFQHLFQAHCLCLDAGDTIGRAHALVNLGHLSQACRRHASARRDFRVAAQLFEQAGDRHLADAARAFEREAASRQRSEKSNPLWN